MVTYLSLRKNGESLKRSPRLIEVILGGLKGKD